MKSKFILLSAAAVMILAAACEQQTGGGNGNGNGNGDSAFQLNTDYFDVPQSGDTISLTYQFVNPCWQHHFIRRRGQPVA